MSNNHYLRRESGQIFLCCGKAGCPSVQVNEEGFVEIKDDFGNTVKMSRSEADLLPEAVEALNEKE